MTVHFVVENHVARVTLDRQDRMNALDDATELELIDIWDKIELDRDIRVVVLTGAGDRAFCAGHDLKQTSTGTGLEYWALPRRGGYGGIALRDTLDVPVIARVNGFALGGGMVLTLGCDIVIASSNARFGLPEPRVGRLALAGGIPQLVRRVPYLHAMDLLLTGRQIDADHAARIGLVNEVVAPENLDSSVDRWVGEILACAPLAARAMKQMVRANERMSSKDAEMLRLPALVEMLQSTDAKEGPLAFREKRAPKWTGK
jgi:enoyl-CoA hydratase/carnithine racemase